MNKLISHLQLSMALNHFMSLLYILFTLKASLSLFGGCVLDMIFPFGRFQWLLIIQILSLIRLVTGLAEVNILCK